MQSLKLLTLLVAIHAAYSLPLPKAPCADDEYSCGNSEIGCVPVEWVCDNVKDCLNGNDENNCNYMFACPVDNFMCKNGECIPAALKCNGQSNCSDGSDEIKCNEKDQPTGAPSSHTTFIRKKRAPKEFGFYASRG